MSEKNKQFLASYARSFLAAVTAVWLAKGFSITDLGNAENVKLLVDAGLAAVLPPVLRALNPKDKAFGLGSDDVIKAVDVIIDEVAKEVAKEEPVKKPATKKATSASVKRTQVK